MQKSIFLILVHISISCYALSQWSIGPRLQSGPTIYFTGSEFKAGVHVSGGVTAYYRGKAPVEMELFTTLGYEGLRVKESSGSFKSFYQRSGIGVNFYLAMQPDRSAELKLGTGLLHAYLYGGLVEGDLFLFNERFTLQEYLVNLVRRNSIGGYMQLGGTKRLNKKTTIHISSVFSGYAIPKDNLNEKKTMPGVGLHLQATLVYRLSQ